jgi:hypothetical protein
VETAWQKKNEFGTMTVDSVECNQACTDGFGNEEIGVCLVLCALKALTSECGEISFTGYYPLKYHPKSIAEGGRT